MKANVGGSDKILRVAAGVALIAFTLLGIIACGVLLWSQSAVKAKPGSDGTTGHVLDEDLTELNRLRVIYLDIHYLALHLRLDLIHKLHRFYNAYDLSRIYDIAHIYIRRGLW